MAALQDQRQQVKGETFRPQRPPVEVGAEAKAGEAAKAEAARSDSADSCDPWREGCDPALREAASDAAADASFSASQIVASFNAWKADRGSTYNNVDGEALELRAFAANEALVRKFLRNVDEGDGE